MARPIDRLLVCLYLVTAASPAIAMVAGLRDHALEGALPPAPQPKLTFAGVESEEYQRAFAQSFESMLGFKGYAIVADNTVLYHAFHETKPGAHVRLGRDGVTFNDEDIDFYNHGPWSLVEDGRVDEIADAIASLQLRLRARGRSLVPVIIPSKTSVYRDAIPEEWTRDRGLRRPSDHVYASVKQALEDRHVVFVDARALLASSTEPRELLWLPDARHWSFYGACLVMKEVAAAHAVLTGVTLPYDCQVTRGALRDRDEQDLWRLLNVWGVEPTASTVPIVTHPTPVANGPKPSVLFIGSSFCWAIMKDAERTKLFASVRMDYYNKTFVEWPDDRYAEVIPHTPAWRDRVLSQDLYVLDLVETYLPLQGYTPEFLSALDSELGP